MTQKTCKERVRSEWKDRKEDFDEMFKNSDYEELSEYGLCIDIVEAGTFEDQEESYIRYQLSFGGPQDELRIFKDGRIEYWFLDWFDGACINVTEDETAQRVRDYIKEIFCEEL